MRFLDSTEVGTGAQPKMGDRLDLESGGTAPSGGSKMRDVGLVGAGIVFGWLTSKDVERPRMPGGSGRLPGRHGGHDPGLRPRCRRPRKKSRRWGRR